MRSIAEILDDLYAVVCAYNTGKTSMKEVSRKIRSIIRLLGKQNVCTGLKEEVEILIEKLHYMHSKMRVRSWALVAQRDLSSEREWW